MAQELENNQEPVEGATQEPEAPLTKEQIEETSMLQELIGVDEPTLQEQIEEEAKSLVGAGMEALEQASPEALEVYEEEIGKVPQMRPATMEEKADIQIDKLGTGQVKSPRQTLKSYDWESQIKYNPQNSPNGFVERLFATPEYEKRINKFGEIYNPDFAGYNPLSVGADLGVMQEFVEDEERIDVNANFDELGKVRDVAGLINNIVDLNADKAFQEGRDFDSDKARIDLIGRLYIDIAFKLGKDISGLDLNNEDFREFLKTYEALDEIQSGLALVRDGRRGKLKQGMGEVMEDVYDRIARRGVFDGSGSSSIYRTGESKEDWESFSGFEKTLKWIPDTLHYTGYRLGEITGLDFIEQPRHTNVGGQVVGTMLPYLASMIGAARTANVAGLGRLGTAMAVEVAGALSDYVFTVEGEGTLANMADEYGLLPESLAWLKATEDDDSESLKNMIEGGLIAAPLALFMYSAKYGGKAAIAWGKEHTPEAMTKRMEHKLARQSDTFKNDAQKIAGMEEPIGFLDNILKKMNIGLTIGKQDDSTVAKLGRLWSFVLENKEAGDERMVEQFTEFFEQSAKDLGATTDEIAEAQAKGGVGVKEKLKAQKKAQISEKEAKDIMGEEWKNLSGSERMNVNQFASFAYRQARAWNDHQKRLLDVIADKKKGNKIVNESGEEVRNPDAYIKNLRRNLERKNEEFKTAHGISLNDWKQKDENLAEFLKKNNVDPRLSVDEIEEVRGLKAKQSTARKEIDEVLENIEDVEVRESIASKLDSDEKLARITDDEAKALDEATEKTLEVQTKKVEETIDDLTDGKVTELDEQLFRNSKQFKNWLDNLEDNELKESILETISTNKRLTESQVKALSDAGFRKIYERLERKGLLDVDLTEVETASSQVKTVRDNINKILEEAELESSVKLERLESELKSKTKKLRDLEEKIAKDEAPITDAQKKKIQDSKDGIKAIESDIDNIKKLREDTPQAIFEKAINSQAKAQKRLDKWNQKLEESNKPLTKEEQADFDSANKAIDDANAEISGIRSLIGTTAKGQLTKALKKLKAKQKALRDSRLNLKEAQDTKVSAQARGKRVEVEAEVKKVEDEIDEVMGEMSNTESAKLNKAVKQLETLKKRLSKWEEKYADSMTLTKAQIKEKADIEKQIVKIQNKIDNTRKLLKLTPRSRFKKQQQNLKAKERRLKELKDELEEAKGQKVSEQEIATQRKRLEKLEVEKQARLQAGRKSPAVSLNRLTKQLEKIESLARSVDEATGEVDSLRSAYGELGTAFKAYTLDPSQENAVNLEVAFYRVQKERVAKAEIDIKVRAEKDNILLSDREVVEQLTQAQKLTKSLPLPAADRELDKYEWSRNNKNNGNWTAADIKNELDGFDNKSNFRWQGKKASNELGLYLDNHQYFKGQSLMKPSMSKYGYPVWLQNARLMRVASYVSGIGTSTLAAFAGVTGTFSRGFFRGAAKRLMSMNRASEVAQYRKLVSAARKHGLKDLKQYDQEPKSFMQWLFTPSRRSKDAFGGAEREMAGVAYGAEGTLLRHMGRDMEATSLTALGARAQAIENPRLRHIATSIVGLLEFMPREVMGGVDDVIKGKTYDYSLRESVVDILWKSDKSKAEDVTYVTDIIDGVRQLEVEIEAGNVRENEIRSWLAKHLGQGEGSNMVEEALLARKSAWEQQRELTLQQQVNEKLKFLQDISRDPLGGQALFFGKTIANTLYMGMERFPILNFLLKDMRDKVLLQKGSPKERIDALAKTLSGATIVGGSAVIANKFRDKITTDKYGNWNIKLPFPRSMLMGQMRELLAQQPSLLPQMVENHNYRASMTGEKQYSLDVEGGADAFINEVLVPKGATASYNFKRLGFGWALIAAGFTLNDVISGTANKLPNSINEKSGLIPQLSSFLDSLTQAYGIGDITGTFQDILNFANSDNKIDQLSHMSAVIIADTLTPWKGLMQSPGEPLVWARKRTEDLIGVGGEPERSIDWDLESWWSTVSQRPWWTPNISGDLPITRRDGMGMPTVRTGRMGFLLDVTFQKSDFEKKMESLDMDIAPVRPRDIPLIMKGVDIMEYKKDNKFAYERIMEIMVEQREGGKSIRQAMNSLFEYSEIEDAELNIADALRLQQIPRWNKKERDAIIEKVSERKGEALTYKDVIDIGVVSQELIRKEVLEIRRGYLNSAMLKFYEEEAALYKDSDNKALKEKIDTTHMHRERIMKLIGG